jgi:hypothetical protein
MNLKILLRSFAKNRDEYLKISNTILSPYYGQKVCAAILQMQLAEDS